jgi:hypothetical protein
MNIVVGDNDTGKSSLLEALNLALTGRLHGRLLAQEISPYLFNLKTTAAYCEGLRAGTNPSPPEFLIDLFFTDAGASIILQGMNNCLTENAYGVRYRVSFNADFAKEYENFTEDPSSVRLIPTEYYKAEWLGFSGNGLTPRSIPAAVSLIDASTIRLQSGADYLPAGQRHLQLRRHWHRPQRGHHQTAQRRGRLHHLHHVNIQVPGVAVALGDGRLRFGGWRGVAVVAVRGFGDDSLL